jgi:hypothetical protein
MYVSQLLASYDYSEVSPQNATTTSLRFSALKKIYMRPLVNLLVTVTVPTCIDLPFITQVCLSLDLKKKTCCRNTSKVYHQLECSLVMVLMVKSMLAGRIR